MKRRGMLAKIAGSVVLLAGCIATDEASQETPSETPPSENPTQTREAVNTSVKERVKECEADYIRTQLITGEDESITDRSGPNVVATEGRADGAYLELETHVGTVRSREGEPNENVDYVVNAAYLVTDEEMYRTEGFEINSRPRDGMTVDC